MAKKVTRMESVTHMRILDPQRMDRLDKLYRDSEVYTSLPDRVSDTPGTWVLTDYRIPIFVSDRSVRDWKYTKCMVDLAAAYTYAQKHDGLKDPKFYLPESWAEDMRSMGRREDGVIRTMRMDPLYKYKSRCKTYYRNAMRLAPDYFPKDFGDSIMSPGIRITDLVWHFSVPFEVWMATLDKLDWMMSNLRDKSSDNIIMIPSREDYGRTLSEILSEEEKRARKAKAEAEKLAKQKAIEERKLAAEKKRKAAQKAKEEAKKLRPEALRDGHRIIMLAAAEHHPGIGNGGRRHA